MKSKPMIYQREAVLRWLEYMRPDVPWRQAVGESLPTLIHRARWDALAEKLGLPYSRGTVANMDSDGFGPLQHEQKLRDDTE